MESVIVIIVSAFALYYLSLKQDHMAGQMFADAFDRFERRYNDITYSCHDATVVRKLITGSINLPLVPSVNYTARALCLTDQGNWFWFDASIQWMKLSSTSITPATSEQASDALKDAPEILERYFPDNNQANTSA
ncbi:MAG: hypothetical protein ACR2PT_19190 [Endozoicomonas sp.]